MHFKSVNQNLNLTWHSYNFRLEVLVKKIYNLIEKCEFPIMECIIDVIEGNFKIIALLKKIYYLYSSMKNHISSR
jgi:hypothetical protein